MERFVDLKNHGPAARIYVLALYTGGGLWISCFQTEKC